MGELGAPPSWTLGVKESICFLAILPWAVFRLLQGRYRLQSKQLVLVIIFSAIICQVVGAQAHLSAYALVGLVIAVPVIQSGQLVGTATFGHFLLQDYVSRRKLIAIGLLLVALCLLCLARVLPQFWESATELAAENARIIDETGSQHPYLFGGICAILAGAAYSFHASLVRYTMKRHWRENYRTWQALSVYDWIGHNFSTDIPAPSNSTVVDSSTSAKKQKIYSPFPITLAMVLINGVGAIFFDGVVFVQRGLPGFYDVPPEWWFWIAIASLTNLIGFFFYVQGLLMTSAAKLSLLSASQIVVLTVLGVLWFNEPMNFMIGIGVAFAVLGVFLSSSEPK